MAKKTPKPQPEPEAPVTKAPEPVLAQIPWITPRGAPCDANGQPIVGDNKR